MITASIVIYKTDKSLLENVLKSIASSDKVEKLYVIDNSPCEETETFIKNSVCASIIEYIPHENTGYGSSHNIALRASISLGADYHLILNPDIYFDSNVISELEQYMDKYSDTVYILPKVLYPNGSIQYLCKLLPSPVHMFFRRFFSVFPITRKVNNQYCLIKSGYNHIMNPPCLSGCFMMLRNSTLKEHDIFFDEQFFMYFEDFDLIRRLHRVGKTIFYPNVSIVHNHAQESYKSSKMLKIHIQSAFKYFNKYGWFFDKERHFMNKVILAEINEIRRLGK